MGFKKIAEPADCTSGYFEKEKQPCVHPEHNPPGHIVLEPGIHAYTCPSCGQVRVISVPREYW